MDKSGKMVLIKNHLVYVRNVNHANQIYTNANVFLPFFVPLFVQHTTICVHAIWCHCVLMISSLIPVCIFIQGICCVFTSHFSSKINITLFVFILFSSSFIAIIRSCGQYACGAFVRF